MKKIPFFIGLLIMSYTAGACEICGCGVGNYYFGLLPHFNKAFVGVRYQFRKFRTRLVDDPTQFSNDFYQSAELWAGWNISKEWQVVALVPYVFNRQVSDEGTLHRHALGDAVLLVNYKFLDIAGASGKTLITQQAWIGGGVKLPTGSFHIDPDDPDVASIANGQTGSGTTDYMVHGTYDLRIGKLGVNTNVNYKINTTNDEGYRFGNRFAANSIAYYVLPAKKATLSPNAGLLFEHNEINKLDKTAVDETGGYALLASAGLEVGFGKWSVGGTLQAPLSQDFAHGQTESKVRGMLHVTVAL